MKSIKIYSLILLALLTVGLGIYITLYHSNIINDRYEQVTIIKNGEITETIHNLDRINNIIEQINSQPRDFYYNNSGLKYDYLPHGRMIFENDKNQRY
ncbi:hypothetical protein [Piscibacillus salipiscarius]|uniref:hypothetical protein n=1 Tax=Piscibacillus salipiscarius TaxID=299480 RepID=UPI0006D10C32|nr:hypothetical protein [Piscibacillus salipiscarius]